MPFKEEMNWDASKKRWHRMHDGVMQRVTANFLGGTTRDGTRSAANEWWKKKQAELDGFVETDPIEVFVESVLDGPQTEEAAPAHEIVDELMTGIVSVQSYKKAVEGLEFGLARPAKITERSVEATAELFLQVAKGDAKPRTYRELRQYFHSLYAEGGPLISTDDVAVINEDRVERMYLDLKNGILAAATKKKRWSFFRRYVRYLWEKRLIDLPRNLDSYSFIVKPKKVKTYPVPEIRKCLDKLKPRLKLYALLGLNCGMTNVDIGCLEKAQVDLDAGTLTRRRVKTGDNHDVPTVCYCLWPQTLQLLRDCWSKHETLALTSSDNTPLWSTTYDGDATRMKDLIGKQWKKKMVPIPLKAFRSISATLIEKHPTYGRFTSHFLGHSPRSVKDRYYAAPPQELFDEALAWLRGELFA